jgi:hypothetical protein
VKIARIAGGLLCVLCLTVSGCRTKGAVAPATNARALPTVDEVLAAQNERAARLDRIWARAVVQLEYQDEGGKRHSAQGEGHLQVVQPDHLALSVGKLGETLYWLGADGERHWVFELGDVDRAMVGRHENVGSPCMQSIGAPVHPLDLLELLGVRPIVGEMTVVGRAEDGTIEIVGPVQSGVRTLWLDADSLVPVRVQISPVRDEVGPVVATLSLYEGVVQSDEGGFFPRMPSRIVAVHPASESRIQIDLSDMSDGAGRGRLPDAAFSFASLVRALGPEEVVVLDESCEHPALSSESLARGKE